MGPRASVEDGHACETEFFALTEEGQKIPARREKDLPSFSLVSSAFASFGMIFPIHI